MTLKECAGEEWSLTILARVLMWVACLPLLQPTGICICKAGPATRAHSQRQSDAEAKHTTSPNCSCRGCKHERDHAPSAPAPDDDPHMPGCPASPGPDRYKYTDPTPSLLSLLPPVAFVTILAYPPAIKPTTVAVSPAIWPSDPPLYLSHCTLVI